MMKGENNRNSSIFEEAPNSERDDNMSSLNFIHDSSRSIHSHNGQDPSSRTENNSVLTSDETVVRRGDGAQVIATSVIGCHGLSSTEIDPIALAKNKTSQGTNGDDAFNCLDNCTILCCCFRQKVSV